MSHRTLFFFVGLLAAMAVITIFSLKPDTSKARTTPTTQADQQLTDQHQPSHDTQTTDQAVALTNANNLTSTSQDNATIEKTELAPPQAESTDQSQSIPSVPESAAQLTKIMSQIEDLYQLSARGEAIPQEKIKETLAGLDEAAESDGIALYEAVEIKGFLLGLMENPSQDMIDKLAEQTATVEELAATRATGEFASDRDRFEAYKREEARLIARVSSAYADNPEQASETLQTEITKLRESFDMQ